MIARVRFCLPPWCLLVTALVACSDPQRTPPPPEAVDETSAAPPPAAPPSTDMVGPGARTGIILKPRRNLAEALNFGHRDKLGARLVRRFPQLGLEVREAPSGMSVDDALAQYEATGAYEYVEPDHPITPAATPNDPHFVDGSLWALNNTGQNGGVADADMDAPEAWNTRTDASSTIVLVVDTGLRYDHEDLAANVWRNPGETAGNGIDDDANGWVDDVHGIDPVGQDGDPFDDHHQGHGTHVAGTIGAVGNNGKGVSGVAWQVKLMPCKIFDANGSGTISSAIACLNYGRAKGAKVANMSIGGAYSYALRDAIASVRTAGMIVVAAAGNVGIDTDGTPAYPAGYDLDNVVSVASTTRWDGLSSFSNYGATSVDLGAPGEDILSTGNGSPTAYVYLSGTSMAAPHVTGALAVLRAQLPSASYQQLIARLHASVDKIPALAGKTKTGGRLNLAAALASTATRAPNDAFTSRAPYGASSCLADASSAGATAETGEPRHAGVAGGRSLWWTWTAPVTAAVTVSTRRSDFDTLLGVYTGSAVNALTHVASNDDDKGVTTSAVTFVATAGTTYQIAVDGKAGATGQVSLTLWQHTRATRSLKLIDLGDAVAPHGWSTATRINAAGEVVGAYEAPGEILTAFRWTSAGGFKTLPTLGGAQAKAISINGNGDAVGWAQTTGNANRNAVLWRKDGTVVDVGRLAGYLHCKANDVNDGLLIVGECWNGDEGGNPRAFKWQSGVFTDLGATAGGVGHSAATAVTNTGRIVGKSLFSGTFRPVEWRNGAPVALAAVDGEAQDINESGQVVGMMLVQQPAGHFEPRPMLISSSGVVTNLNPAAGGGAWSINGKGEIAMTVHDRAALYRNGTVTLLDDLLTWDSCGGHAYDAAGINDAGQIVGQLYRMNVPHAYIGVPQSCSATSGPAAPTGLAATPGNGQVTLSWAAVSGATGYTIKRRSASGDGHATIVADISATSFTDTGLTNGTTYSYVVAALNCWGPGADSTAASAVPNPPMGTGSLSRETWNNVTGVNISDIPLANAPTSTGTITSFELPANAGDNYGVRIRGYITPPTTGSYTFWLASDDAGQFWISSDNTAANKVLRASVSGWTNVGEWNKYPSQKSVALNLTAGQAYYVEALVKEGTGGDHLAVGWARPGQATTAPSEIVPGSVLSPFANGCSATSGPAAPTGLSATAGDAQVALTWSAVAGATSYTIKRSTTNGGGYANVGTVTGTTFTNTGLANGTTYHYVVAASNCFGPGANSAQVQATPQAPQLPTPIVRLAFNENSGTSVANTGSSGGTLTRTSPTPAWSTNVPAGVGGASAIDFGTVTGNFAVDSSAAIASLGGLTRFTITGWVNNRSASEGWGGNRVVTWLANGGHGVELVYKADGSLQLGINQWSDATTTTPRSSAGKITTDAAAPAGNWRFFAITYDSTLASDNVRFYFGTNAADATLDVTRTYARGAIGASIGPLSIGHFNNLNRANAQDRMFRGLIDNVRVWGQALTATQVVQAQRQ